MTAGLLLQLSGPLQSWGSRSHWQERDTLLFPSRSGLIGMLAAAEGLTRGAPLDCYASLEFTIRIDRPGRMMVDYHTVGGGRPRDQTPPLAKGRVRAEREGTIVSQRHYLTDAAFTVAVTSTKAGRIGELGAKLAAPHYGMHLGRRSCPPSGPLVLAYHDDPVAALTRCVPLARKRPQERDTVSIDMVAERPPVSDGSVRTATHSTLPVEFGAAREYRQHTTWHSTYALPASLCAGFGTDYLTAVLDFRDSTP